jgi:hypothetical protein
LCCRWYITGGGDSSAGVPDTSVLDLETHTWSVALTASSAAISSEGLSMVVVERRAARVLVCSNRLPNPNPNPNFNTCSS